MKIGQHLVGSEQRCALGRIDECVVDDDIASPGVPRNEVDGHRKRCGTAYVAFERNDVQAARQQRRNRRRDALRPAREHICGETLARKAFRDRGAHSGPGPGDDTGRSKVQRYRLESVSDARSENVKSKAETSGTASRKSSVRSPSESIRTSA